MGDVRGGAGKTGAQVLPLTRRQQKLARQRPATPQPRQTQPPQQRKAAPPQLPVRGSGKTKLALSSPARAAEAPRIEKLAAATQVRHSGPMVSDQAEATRKRSATKSRPRRPANILMERARSTGGTQALKTAAPSASGRKYPTLAQMVAVTPRKTREPAADPEIAPDEPVQTAERSAYQESARISENTDPALAVGGDLSAGSLGMPSVPPSVPDGLPTSITPRPSISTRRLQLTVDPPRSGAAMDSLEVSDPTVRALIAKRPSPLPTSDLVVPVAAVYATAAAVAALVGAMLLLAAIGQPAWPLALAGIAGVGGGLGYMLAERSRGWAVGVLLLTSLGVLAWLLALLGARAALLTLVPVVALLALRWLGRVAAYAVALAALTLYALAVALTLSGTFTAPVTLAPGGYALLDMLVVGVGFVAMLLMASHLHGRWVRAELAARARRHEVRTLRLRLAQMRQQVEDDAEQLNAELARALIGQAVDPVESDGLLSPLAETTNAAAERLVTLERDREDRMRLEGAIRTVTRAVERAWLGLPWSWPEWSGTVLDELVALLRAPRPQETRADWSDETPTLTAIPTAERGMTPQPWEQTGPISAPMPTVRAAWSQALSARDLRRQAETLAAGVKGPSARLPWDEWNTWHEWVAARDD